MFLLIIKHAESRVIRRFIVQELLHTTRIYLQFLHHCTAETSDHFSFNRIYLTVYLLTREMVCFWR